MSNQMCVAMDDNIFGKTVHELYEIFQRDLTLTLCNQILQLL